MDILQPIFENVISHWLGYLSLVIWAGVMGALRAKFDRNWDMAAIGALVAVAALIFIYREGIEPYLKEGPLSSKEIESKIRDWGTLAGYSIRRGSTSSDEIFHYIYQVRGNVVHVVLKNSNGERILTIQNQIKYSEKHRFLFEKFSLSQKDRFSKILGLELLRYGVEHVFAVRDDIEPPERYIIVKKSASIGALTKNNFFDDINYIMDAGEVVRHIIYLHLEYPASNKGM